MPVLTVRLYRRHLAVYNYCMEIKYAPPPPRINVGDMVRGYTYPSGYGRGMGRPGLGLVIKQREAADISTNPVGIDSYVIWCVNDDTDGRGVWRPNCFLELVAGEAL